jgi:hypothetical protein
MAGVCAGGGRREAGGRSVADVIGTWQRHDRGVAGCKSVTGMTWQE